MRTSLKILILTTLAASLAVAFFPELFGKLALSKAGLEHYYLWQPISYIFIEQGPLSLSFFIQLAFNMYILWMFGSSLIERCGARLFLCLYLGSGFAAALSILAFPGVALAGSTHPVYAVLIGWMMLNPESHLLLFFALPFKSQWLILGLISLTLLGYLTSANWAGAAALIGSVLYAYLFILTIFRQRSPFPILYRFERKILRLFERNPAERYHRSKIYDIQSGAPVLDDDQFMDAMLDRISRHGAESLTPSEKKRMKEISERKK